MSAGHTGSRVEHAGPMLKYSSYRSKHKQFYGDHKEVPPDEHILQAKFSCFTHQLVIPVCKLQSPHVHGHVSDNTYQICEGGCLNQ